MNMQSLWKDSYRPSKTKTSKFTGWCAECGLMQMKSDKGICPKCGGTDKTHIAPEMKEFVKLERLA